MIMTNIQQVAPSDKNFSAQSWQGHEFIVFIKGKQWSFAEEIQGQNFDMYSINEVIIQYFILY